jgi:hypothetical protein
MQGLPISEFISKIKSDGLARTNRFAVMMPLPSVLGGGANPYMANSMEVSLLCENIVLPGINLNSIQNRTYGELRETPYETMYDAITATFYVDRKMKVKHLFDSWILAVQGYGGPRNGTGTRNFRYYDEYTVPQMQIYVNDTLNQTYYGVSLYEVYPKTVSSITLDNNSKEIMKLTVTFQYKFWRPGLFSQSRTPVHVDLTQDRAPLPTNLGPQPVEQRGAMGQWQDAWNDVQEWIGNPSIPDFNINGADVGTLRNMISF